MNKFKEKLEKILKKEEGFLDEKKGLDYIKIKDSADKIDYKLIELLASNKEIKEKFFTKVKDMYVFKINDFKFFLDENKVNNSYTEYKNRIGLSDKTDFLKERTEVVLDFPFKDCVLQGGQEKEDGNDTYFQYEEEKEKTEKGKKVKVGAGYKEKQGKRKETFFNEVLARDEIDRLFEKKALVNWKRFTKKGEEKVGEIKRDKEINEKRGLPEDTITDNLVIKGNNLLALHSLKSQFAGKVKLIYIDPPYNTGNDSFNYNDNFNHSTWLTFMKNRLEIAKDLLKDDGVIFVQCDDNEQAYLKVLMDEVFGHENFINTIVMKTINPNGIKTTHATKTILKVKEQIIVFKKNNVIFKPQYKAINKYDKYYDLFIEGNIENLKNCKVIKLKEKIKSLGYKFDLKDEKFRKFIINNSNKIFQTKFDKRVQNNPKYADGGLYIYDGNPNYFVFQKRFGLKLSKVVKNVFGRKEIGILLGDVWDDFKLNNLYLEGGVDFSNAKKPEHLMYRIIEMSTKKGDIVLDYHLGSGTTCAVAHKMGRQYIGIEQMDYIEDIAVERLKKVIDGEQGGISKSVDWKGGGDFVYFELAQWNKKAKEEILKAKDLKSLVEFFEEKMYTKYFLHYNVKIKEFTQKIVKEENFLKLDFKEQKKMFVAMLDNNQMYVNASEIEDKKFDVDKEDIKSTKEFYSKK